MFSLVFTFRYFFIVNWLVLLKCFFVGNKSSWYKSCITSFYTLFIFKQGYIDFCIRIQTIVYVLLRFLSTLNWILSFAKVKLVILCSSYA